MFNAGNTHLTERQIEIFEMKKEGKSLSQIADELDTTRSNVSHILKTARENIERARNTVRFADTLEWPLEVKVEAGSDLYDVSQEIFERADDKEIHLGYTGSELIDLFAEKAADRIEDRVVQEDIGVRVGRDGQVEISPLQI